MRASGLFASLLLTLGSTFSSDVCSEAESRVVSLVGDPWPPYVIGELGQEASGGHGVALMKAIFDRLEGPILSLPLIPWNRALRDVRRGTRDGIAILLKTPEREAYMAYTDELFRSHNTVWYSAARFPDEFDWQQYGELSEYMIGVVQGQSYGDELDQLMADGTLTTVEVPSSRQLFTMLDKGRIDLVIADRLVGAAFVEEITGGQSRLRAAKKPATAEIYHIGFSKNSEARHLIPEINRAIANLRAEGVIQKLVGAAHDVATPASQGD